MNLYSEWIDRGFDTKFQYEDWLEYEVQNLRKQLAELIKVDENIKSEQ